jgi:beta-lactamase class A
MQDLVAKLNDISDSQPFTTSWYFKNLRTGETANRAGDVVVPSASTRKIAILATALKQVHEGKYSLDQMVEMQAKYQDNNSGCFQHFDPGFEITFKDVLVMMIIVSDNTCTGTTADMVGLDAVNELCQSIGMTGTTHRQGIPHGLYWDHPVELSNTTTPNDVGLLLEAMLAGSKDADAAAKLGSTPELLQVGMDILTWQKLRARLPALLPGGTIVAHKTGTGARNINDAGIIYGPDNQPLFTLTVYTDHQQQTTPDGLPWQAGGTHMINNLCRACWDALV